MKQSGRFSRKDSKLFSNFPLTSNRTNSVSAGAAFKGKLYTLWPEFNETDINSEKWEATVKADKRGKSPSTPAGYQQCFDDPEGKVEMPSNMQVNTWSRITQEVNPPKPFVVVENEEDFDIINYSKHLCCYPLLRMIMSQITLLWNMETQKRNSNNRNGSSPDLGFDARWKPWEHIYSMCKANKAHIPQFNPNGKYICRLFYMGCWRKVTIDDSVPYNAEMQLLLPTSGYKNELWPMLLTKALLKVASVNYRQGNSNEMELNEFSVIHCLTGWIPEITPLYPIPETWECLKNFLPKWNYPTAEVKQEEGIESEEAVVVPQPQQPLTIKERSISKMNPSQVKMKNKKEGDSSTSNFQRKESRREKVKNFEQSKEMQDTKSETFEYTHPETMIFATFDQNCPKPPPLSCIKDMSDGSEVLRSQGLSSSMYHPILIKQTRSIPLLPPVVVPPIPRWKLIRPRPNNTEGEKPPLKPDMWLEVCSPFITAPNTQHTVSQLQEVDEDELIDTIQSESLVGTTTADATPAISPVKQPSNMRPSAGGDNLKKGSLKPSSVASLKKKGQESNYLLQTVADGKKSEKSEVNINHVPPPVSKVSNEYKMQEDANFIKNIWIDFDDFCKTFKHIVIFHKPHTYKYNATSFEFKPSVTNNSAILSQTPLPGSGNSGGKKSNLPSSSTNIHPKHAEKNTVTSINNYNAETCDKQSEETHSTTYLMVDSIEPSEVVICLSALTYWPGTDIKYLSIKQDQTSTGESNSDVLEKKESRLPLNGRNYESSVVLEPFSWLDYKAYQTCMHINTCGTKALCLQLPAGRNLLKLNISWNFGHHLHLCSTTPFTYGDENLVMHPLKEESERFKLVARDIANCIDQLLNSVGNVKKWKKCMKNLTKAYFRNTEDENTFQLHKNVFHKALYALMERLLIDTSTLDVRHLCRVVTGNFTPLSVLVDDSKTEPQSIVTELSDIHLEANIIIQKFLRGHIVRKTVRDFFSVQFRDSGIMAQLKSALKTNQLSHGIFILRKMLKLEPSLIEKYNFKDDELKKCCYTEYQENFPEQSSHHWFIVFRGVFSCEEDTWLVPTLQGITPTNYLLHVVDNDTGKEVRRIFNKNIPHLYTKNQQGYTMVCEMRTGEMPLVGGKWKLKLIGQQPPQLQPITHIESNFVIKEFKGYYIPNEKFVIFKYTAHCKVSQVVSIQIETSNKQAQFKLEIFNKGQLIASRTSRGQMFLPYCYLVGKTTAKVEQEKESKDTEKGKNKGGRNKKETKRAESPKDDKKRDSKHESEEEDIESRMYYIKVTLLNYSWRLNTDELQFVEKLKEQELEEFRLVVPKQELGLPVEDGNPSKHTLHTPRGASSRRSKTGNKKKGEVYDNYTNSKTSITENVMIDPSKPSWQMRVVVDQDRGEDIVVERDMTRQKQVKAMKMAWEALDEGRAERAKEIRQKYLDSLKIKDEEQNKLKKPVPESSIGIKNPFEPEPEKKEPVYLTPDELNQAELERHEKRKLDDENNRKDLEIFLAEDLKKRNMMKEKLMEEIQQLQLETDMYRTHLLQSRNEYRQQMIDDARYELEKKEAQLHDDDKLDGRKSKNKSKKKK